MFIPDYLKTPKCEGYIFGKLEYDSKTKEFILSGDYMMLEFAKRLFPGSMSSGKEKIRVRATDRSVSDLNWLMLRFPLKVICESEMIRQRNAVIEKVNRRAVDGDLVRVTPPKEFLGKLYSFQEEAVTFMTVNKRVLLADHMGLGKTWSALGAAAHAGEYPVLVVCQPHVQRQWQRAIGSLFDMGTYQKRLDDDLLTIASERGEQIAPILKGRTPYDIPDTPFSITHYGLIQDWIKPLRDRGYPIVIFDEVQELRHTGTRKYSAASLLSSDADHMYALSGTPIYGYGSEIWNVMNSVAFNCLGSYEVFSREWCTGYLSKTVSDPKALNAMMVRDGLMLRRKYEDENVRIALPTVDRKIIDVDYDTELYDTLIVSAKKSAGEYQSKKWGDRGRIARDVERETRHATGLSKAPFVADFIASLIDAGEKPLVYAWHHSVHDVLGERLRKYRPSVLTGKQTEKQKDVGLKQFIRGDTDVCVLSLRSAAGIDGLQTRATCCVFAELDWSPAIHCFDEHTEVLTPDGFMGVDSLSSGDVVAGFDVKNGNIHWVKSNGKVDRPMMHGEKMYKSTTHRMDLAVTGDHRMVYRSLKRTTSGNVKSDWGVSLAKDIAGKKRRYVPTCGRQSAKGVSLSDDELKLIGLFITDGHFNGKTLSIYQMEHQPWNREIVDILNGSGLRWTLFQREQGVYGKCNWYGISKGERRSASNKMGVLKGWSSIVEYLDKDFSPLLEDCTPDQLDCILRGMWIGDGTKHDHSVIRITKTNKTMMERLQSLCVRRGRSAVLRTRPTKTSGGKTIYDIHVYKSEDAYLQDSKDRPNSFQVDESVGAGTRVWCMTNELGTLVTRKNGKVVVTGNSQAETRIARIGVDKTLENIPSYYCVSSTGYDEVMQDILGVKIGQFKGLMGDEPEDAEEQREAEKRAERRIKELILRLNAN